MRRISLAGACAGLFAAALAITPLSAQELSNQNIKLVVGFAAGSGADVYVRYFANKLTQVSKRTVIVENRPGAAASIAVEYVARAKPDGHTLLAAGGATLASQLYLFKKPTTDPRKDFVYISPLLGQGFILMVDEQAPFKTLADLTAHLKAKKDKGSYATSNNPSTILSEIYKAAAGLDTLQVQYRNSADYINDMLGGRIDFAMADPVFALAQINQGKFRPLGISTGKRIQSLPDIPTLQEAGIPNVDMNFWWTAAAPAGTPQPIVDQLNGWFTEIGKMDDTREFLARFGSEPFIATPAQTKALIDKDVANWAEYVKLAKLEPQ